MDYPLSRNQPQAASLRDQHLRPLRELRLSVIDRCNFRCSYCMPAGSLKVRGSLLPLDSLLTDHEITTLVGAFVELGVHKLRITGGEPLLRPGLPALIGQLAGIPGLDEIALTTNAVLLPRLATDLAAAGLGRITVSLDTLDPQVLTQMSGGRAQIGKILDGIAAAEAAGFHRLKINTVVQRGVNDHTVMDLLAHFRGTRHTVRLIEFMDVGNTNHWSRDDVVPSSEWRERINQRWPIQPLDATHPGETARRYAYVDGLGEIGLISSITQPFCGGCTRARVTADGRFFSCLFASQGVELVPLIRSGDNGKLRRKLRSLWSARTDRYSAERDLKGDGRPKAEMYLLGG